MFVSKNTNTGLEPSEPVFVCIPFNVPLYPYCHPCAQLDTPGEHRLAVVDKPPDAAARFNTATASMLLSKWLMQKTNSFLLQVVLLGLAGLVDGSISTLAPIFRPLRRIGPSQRFWWVPNRVSKEVEPGFPV